MTSTLVLKPAETTSTSPYVLPWRPWLTLYGLRLRPGQGPQADLSVIQTIFPEEILLRVFSNLSAYHLAHCGCVCRQWKQLTVYDALWERACYEAFGRSENVGIHRLLRSHYRGCWRTMFLERPHLRFDGLYASRNTYIRTGVQEWRIKNPVHVVCYYRYIRFLPDGTFLYRTSPEVLSKVAPALRSTPQRQRADVHKGCFRLKGDKLETAMIYPNCATTEVRSRLRLRSTVPGANNRLDVESIMSYDRGDGVLTPMLGLGPDDEMAGMQAHRRGLSTYVFVPWERVLDSPLNKPIEQMDVYIPG